MRRWETGNVRPVTTGSQSGWDDTMARAYQNVAWLMATCPEERFRNPTLAVRAAKKALELDGATYLGWDTYAAALASVGQYAQATAAQRKAVSSAPAEEKSGSNHANSTLPAATTVHCPAGQRKYPARHS